MPDFLLFFLENSMERVGELYCQTQSSTLVQIISPNAFQWKQNLPVPDSEALLL